MHRIGLLVVASVIMSAPVPASAQTADFTGKQVKVLIGFGPGGGYDQYGRLIAANIGRFLPGNPTVVAQNMPGGGSVVAARRIYSTSPKDGTEFAILARDAITQPLTTPGGEGLFDATKFSWLGSPDSETNICFANASSGIKTAQDLLSKPLVVGADGVGTGSYIYPTVLNGMVGTKFKVVNGYTTSNEIFLAMERHEVEGGCDSYSSVMRKDAKAIKDGKILILFWAGYPLPELKDIPHVTSIVSKAEDRQLLDFMYAGQTYARPFIAPPDMPAPIYKALKEAFANTLKDPQTLADAAQQSLEIRPVSAAETVETVKKAYATPKPLIERMARFLKNAAG